jgi:hypothetical protein
MDKEIKPEDLFTPMLSTMQLVQLRDATLDPKIAMAWDELILFRNDPVHKPKFNHKPIILF